MDADTVSHARFPGLIQVRCPANLPGLIEAAARRQLMTPSEYTRRCLYERLAADGFMQLHHADPLMAQGEGPRD